MNKSYFYQVLNIQGATIYGNINPLYIKNYPNFHMLINKGYGELTIDLNMPFDDFDDLIDYMNLVKIYEYDSENPNGRLLYRGHIEEIRPYKTKSNEGVEVDLFPMNTRFERDIYETSNTNPGVTFINVDTSVIFKAIIDDFKLGNSSTYGNLVGYGNSTIADVGTTISLGLAKLTHAQWMEETYNKIGVSGYYYFLDVNGVFYFQPKGPSAFHSFTVGKDVDEIRGRGSIKDMINESTAAFGASTNGTGETYVTALGLSSIALYGRRKKYTTDNRIKDLSTANNQVVQDVAQAKDPKEGCDLIINSNYDIETVIPGQTCKLQNTKSNARVFNNNMWINSIEYSKDRISLQLEDNNRIIQYQLKEWFKDQSSKLNN